jgi:mycothiol synthase
MSSFRLDGLVVRVRKGAVVSLPDGLTVRRGRGDEIDAVTATLVAEEVAVRGASGWGATDTADWWRGLELRGEAWVAEADGGAIAGCLGLFTRGDEFDGWISVHPDFGGRGLGGRLIEHAERRSKDLGGKILKLGSFAENLDAQRLLARAGYHPVRRFYRMQIDLDRPPPEPGWPTGVTCATFDVAEARALHAAVQDAFAENWDSRPLPFEEWKALRIDAPDFDPMLWLVARDGGEIAGFARCEHKRWGMGWIAALGVRKPWRRRGLGLALLLRAFGEFYERGEPRVGLGVDSENQTGATRLYERAGMSVIAEDVVWQKELT